MSGFEVLVVGSGGREHALALALSKDPTVTGVHCAPGNPGTEHIALNHAIDPEDPAMIAALAVALIGVDQGGDAWGRPWLVPTEPGRSMTQAVADASQITGTPLRSPRPLPGFVRAAAHLMPIVRELDEMAPTFATPYEVDTRAAQERFGLAATPWTQALTETITWMRGR